MFRMVPPAAAPIKLNEILNGVGAVMSGRTAAQFKRDLCDYLNVKYGFFTSSGRAALATILKVMAEKSGKDEVIIPAYTCFSVPSAIVKAGFKIRLCDINRETLDLELGELAKTDWRKVLCVVPSNLFGLPSNLPEISRIANEHGARVIDDAAQSLGGTVGGVKSGAAGDAGLFSLGRGKVLSTYEGGIIVTRSDEMAQKLSKYSLMLNGKARWPAIGTLIKLLGYSILLHPRLYWIPNRMPFLELGSSKFDPDFAVGGLSGLQTAIGCSVFKKLDDWNDIRRKNAKVLYEGLKTHKELTTPKPLPHCDPIYLRFPILVMNPQLREKIYSNLIANGIGASKVYPTGIHQIPAVAHHLVNPGGKFPQTDLVASSILTLPTHPLLTSKDLDRITETIGRCF
jgi:dTDP-4-amino-4,6-dideoxygalactose transaminase